jgi:hypothetical protein
MLDIWNELATMEPVEDKVVPSSRSENMEVFGTLLGKRGNLNYSMSWSAAPMQKAGQGWETTNRGVQRTEYDIVNSHNIFEIFFY